MYLYKILLLIVFWVGLTFTKNSTTNVTKLATNNNIMHSIILNSCNSGFVQDQTGKCRKIIED